ncbi:complex I NDUFA9 subunit family protein [Nitrobacter winogradskyi]|uniref:NADH dehydrogenase n=1 Tax=Nitrobacter winogradskyi TaxID=913 RepID=A0ACC6AH21_NITWI|nr:complex I NDUFA9 subunit family protein [Nitrobacter winogradskyi]MCP1999150.1 NADH dehydrogenase [Nitrobacter winogradskyi]
MEDAARPSGKARSRLELTTVFGGSGFLGRRIVKHLLDDGAAVRAASRHSTLAKRPQVYGGSLSAVKADILDQEQVAAAVSGASTVINAVSLYTERGDVTFERVHVEAASRLAAAARDAGAVRYIQISGIGSNPRAASAYIRARGQGEEAVGAAFPNSIIVRPAVMTGSDDAFLTTIVRLLRILPVYPLFGSGDTRLQPAYVEDVAEAIARLALGASDPEARLFEFGEPRVYSYRELVEEISRLLDVRARLMPVPFWAWRALAIVAELVPGAPLTRNQVELMQIDNVAARSGFRELGIEPRDIDVVVQAIREKSRP